MKTKKTKFRSKYEAQFAAELDAQGVLYEYEPDSFEYIVKKRYTPDFKIYLPDGSFQFVELKGWLCPRSKIALHCIRQQYPDLPLVINYQKDNRGYRNWAEKQGLAATVGIKEFISRTFGLTPTKVQSLPKTPPTNTGRKAGQSRTKASTSNKRGGSHLGNPTGME